MRVLEILLGVYAFLDLVLVWRYTVIVNRLRAQALLHGAPKTSFSDFVPQILRDAFSFPVLILWYGLEAFIKGLE